MLPASGTRVVPDAPGFAVAEKDGVRLAASGDDWRERRPELPARLTAVRVRIVNHSGHDLQILYDRFTIAGARGRVYYPLPPLPLADVRRMEAIGVVRPYFASSSFFVRPALKDVYPSLPPWSLRLPSDDDVEQRQYAFWGDGLPMGEVRRLSLPEGILADGGQLSGFLFFENTTRRESEVSFDADLKDGQGDRTIASLSIPFRIE